MRTPRGATSITPTRPPTNQPTSAAMTGSTFVVSDPANHPIAPIKPPQQAAATNKDQTRRGRADDMREL
jgi:hypothetical protein